MIALTHLALAALGAAVSLCGFLSLPVFGLWGPSAWIAFLVGVAGAAIMVIALAAAISRVR